MKGIYSTLLWVVLCFGIIMALVLIALQVPSVKHYFAQKAIQEFSRETNHKMELGEIQISWFDHVNVSDLRVYDFQDSLMLKADEANVNFNLFGIWSEGQLNIDDILVRNGQISMVRYDTANTLNLKYFVDKLKSMTNKEAKKSGQINLGNVELDGLLVSYNNLSVLSEIKETFDLNHFNFNIDQALFHEFLIKKDTITSSVISLHGKEDRSGFEIENFTGDIFIDNKHIAFSNFLLNTGKSKIGDSVALSFNHFGNLSNFQDSVRMAIDFEQSTLALSDLAYFGNIEASDTVLNVSIKANGELSRIFIEEVDIRLESGSYIQGEGSIIGFPNISSTFIDLTVSDGMVLGEDIRKTVGKYSFRDDVRFKGNFLGFAKDFVVQSNFYTRHGRITTDINFKIPESIRDTKYSGRLQLLGFDLGRVLGNADFSTIDLQSSIKGQGISKETFKLTVVAEAQSLAYRGYTYDSLQVSGEFSSNSFESALSINDQHCKLWGETKLNFYKDNESIAVDLTIDSLHLKELHLSREDFDVSATVSVNLKYLDIDKALGNIDLKEVTLRNGATSYVIDKAKISSIRKENERSYIVDFPKFSGKVTGTFLPSIIIKDLPNAVKSYYVLLTSERDSIGYLADFNPEDTLTTYDMALSFGGDLNGFPRLLDAPFRLGHLTQIEASFAKRKNVNFSVFAETDTLLIGSDSLFYNTLDINSSRDINSTDVLSIIQLNSSQQKWLSTAPTSDLFLESLWFNNTINNHLEVTQEEFENELQLNSEVRYTKDSIIMDLQPSTIKVVGARWRLDRRNRTAWSNDILSFSNINFANDKQSLNLAGSYSSSEGADIDFEVSSFDIKNLSSLIGEENSGILDVDGKIYTDTSNHQLIVQGNSSIKNLFVKDFSVGNMEGHIGWNQNEQQFEIDYRLIRETLETIVLKGQYYPREEYDQLQLLLQFDEARLGLIEPFIKKQFSNLSGFLSGNLYIGGPISGPTFYGNGAISNGGITVNYTNTSYLLSGNLSFDSYEISFRGLDVKDNLNGSGRLYGSVYHNNLSNLQIDFLTEFDNLQLLNTSQKNNSVYYGRAFGTGNMRLSGSVSNLKFNAELATNQGTRIYFPLEEAGSIEQEEYITFVNPLELAKEAEPKEVQRNLGIEVDMDLNITSDAYAELIFDAQSGDVIRGRANGNIQLNMDSNGEISLLGGIEIENGAYNFTVPGINKEFQLRKGGTINWSGDPYAGTIDLEATYRQLADLSDWDNSIANTSKIPFLVVLDLQGAMLQPNISFSIESADDVTVLPGVDSQGLRRFLITTNDREDELNRQVFSLLMLRKLSPQNSFQLGEVGRGISGSVSEIVSNQLSYWLSQSNENLEVDIDLVGLDQDAFNTFQYRLAYTFLDGRLKVSGGNSVNNALDNTNTGIADRRNSILGNWSVEYLLSSDGRLRAKFFSRTNQSFTTDVENNQQTGLSFQYIRSFDQFKELVGKARSSEPENEEAPIESPTSAKAN